MTPPGVLVHHIAGRTRVRVPAKRGDSAYFATVSEQLAHCPGVVSVMTSDATAGVLVVHDGAEPDVLADYARTFELFDLPDAAPAAMERGRPPADILTSGLHQLDDWVRTGTGQSADLRAVALTALVGAAAWQLLRGQTLPAAATLLWYAWHLASKNGETPAGWRSEEEHGRQAQNEERIPSRR